LGLAAVAVVALAVTGVKLFVLDARAAGAASGPEAATDFVESLADYRFSDLGKVTSPADLALFEGKLGPVAKAMLPLSGADSFLDTITVSLDDLSASVLETFSADIQSIQLEGGTMTIDGDIDELVKSMMQGVDPSGMAGSIMASTLGDSLKPLKEALPFTLDFGALATQSPVPIQLVAVREGSGWYISPVLTIAEYAFLAARDENPSLQRGEPLASGQRKSFGSPTEAVEGMKQALARTLETGDITEVAAALPEAESRLVALYGPAVFDGIREVLADPGGITVSLEELSATPLTTDSSWVRMGLDNFRLSLRPSAGPASSVIDLSRAGDESYDLNITVDDPEGDGPRSVNGTLSATGGERWEVYYEVRQGGETIEGNLMARISAGDSGFSMKHVESGEPKVDLSISLDSECFSYIDSLDGSQSQSMCKSEDPQIALILSPLNAALAEFPGLPHPATIFGITAVNTSGGWNISALWSLLGIGQK